MYTSRQMSAAIFLNAYLSGSPAGAVLRDAARLEIAAVFSRSAYARDENGNHVCFLKSGMEPGPLNILCSGWPEEGARSALSPGEALTRVAANVWRTKHVHIAVDAAAPWEAPPWPRFDSGLAEKGVRAFRGGLAECAPEDSLASLLLLRARASSPGISADSVTAALFDAARPGARLLDKWLRDDSQHFDPGILSLLGLGKGLTPSGDDFLGGALLAMRAVGMTEEHMVLARRVSEAAGGLTNSISSAHLAAASRGAGAEALHLFIIALMRGGVPQSVSARLSSVGHTSGWDAAAGAALVVAARAKIESILE